MTPTPDPRRILQEAAEQRSSCDLYNRGGGWSKGRIVRVEPGGVVMVAPGLRSGSDIRCWLSVNGLAYTFSASVLRTGVLVPDRSQDGVMLGFIDDFKRAERQVSNLLLEAIPATGGPVSLLSGDVRIVDLTPQEWTVTTASAFPLVFVEQGGLRLRIGLPDSPPMDLSARVHALSRGDGHLLYALRIEQVGDPVRYREIIDGVRRVLGI